MRGFTLIEILIVLAIVGVIAGIGVARLSAFRDRASLTDFSSNVVGLFAEARARTLSSEGDSVYGVHVEASRAALFKGSTFVDGSADQITLSAPVGISISPISLSGGVSDVVFSRLTGEASAYGTFTVRVTNDASASTTITITATGVVANE